MARSQRDICLASELTMLRFVQCSHACFKTTSVGVPTSRIIKVLVRKQEQCTMKQMHICTGPEMIPSPEMIPQTGPEMIPRPEMIPPNWTRNDPQLDLKWSRPQNDPQLDLKWSRGKFRNGMASIGSVDEHSITFVTFNDKNSNNKNDNLKLKLK